MDTGSLCVVPLRKTLGGIPHLRVVDRWLVTSKRIRHCILMRFDPGKKDKHATLNKIQILRMINAKSVNDLACVYMLQIDSGQKHHQYSANTQYKKIKLC